MNQPPSSTAELEEKRLPVLFDGMPLLHEDDEDDEMGEANVHHDSEDILWYGIRAHLHDDPRYGVFANLNVYYNPYQPELYFSPDVMVVMPPVPLEYDLNSYRIGQHGPSPVLAVEVLSKRSAKQRDLDEKIVLYAHLAVDAYILVDVTRRFMPRQLLIKRLQPNRVWIDDYDPDGGVTSKLGFRAIVDDDGYVRILDTLTNAGYVWPGEAEAEVRAARQRAQVEAVARQKAEERARAEAGARQATEDELAALRAMWKKQQNAKGSHS